MNIRSRYIARIIIAYLFPLIFACNNEYIEKEKHILPSGYIGDIYMIFNQYDGLDRQYEDGKRIYYIPPSGVLKTKFNANYGIIPMQKDGWVEFFYKDTVQGYQRLKKHISKGYKSINDYNYDSNQIIVFPRGYRNIRINNSNSIEVYSYFIDTVKNYNNTDHNFNLTSDMIDNWIGNISDFLSNSSYINQFKAYVGEGSISSFEELKYVFNSRGGTLDEAKAMFRQVLNRNDIIDQILRNQNLMNNLGLIDPVTARNDLLNIINADPFDDRIYSFINIYP